MKKLIAAAMIGAISITAFTGCGVQNEDNRTVINKENKQIVVIEKKEASGKNDLTADLMLFENIRVLDWISEDIVLIMKENKDMPQYQAEMGMAYPQNFYEFNIKTKEEKRITDSELNMSHGILSPDKKHIFYKEGIEENLTGFILNRETGKKVQATDIDSILSYEGQWIDNRTVILSSFPEGKIMLVDVEGNKTELGKPAEKMIANTNRIGDRIYYTTMDEGFYVQDLDGKNRKLLMEGAVWVIPSPDKTRFAMVKHTAQTERTLLITDLEGKEITKLSKATQIYGVSWSPDQSKVTYVTMEPESNSGGLFVADAETGSTQQLSLVQNAADPLRWSPSGKQISVTNFVFDEVEKVYKHIAILIQLKEE